MCGKSIADVYTTSCIATADKIIPEKPTNWKGVREEQKKEEEEEEEKKKKEKSCAGRLGGSRNDKYIRWWRGRIHVYNSSHLVHGDAPLAQKARDNYRERSCKRVRRRKNGIYYIYVHKEGKKHRDE